MKILLLLALLLTVFVACKKDKTTPAPSAFTLSGNWRWILTQGGIAGIRETPASTGHTMKYTFGSDSSFTLTTDTSAVTSTYHTNTLVAVGSTIYLVTLGTMAQQAYTHYNDTLIISDYGISDGFSNFFVKE